MQGEPDIEHQYAVALRAGRIGMWAWDEGVETLILDERAREIAGLAPVVRLTVEGFARLIDERERQGFATAWAAALDRSGPGRIDVECRLVRPADRSTISIALQGEADRPASGPARLVGILRDVSEARRAADASRRSEALFAGIVAIAADAIISIDEQQHITLFNNGAEQMFGYARAEAIGRPLDILLPERFQAAHNSHVRMFGRAGVSARRMGERSEIYGRRKSGEEFAAEASISHLEIAGEQIYTVVMRDITERKCAEQELTAANQALESRVEARTRELKSEMARREETQAQLVRTQRMEAFGQLTGGIAHDFNNLLTVITGNLELLEMRITDEKARTLLARAQGAAEMGARLTSRLLTFARRRNFASEPLNLNEQILGMVDLLRRSLGEHIHLSARLEPKLWTVEADASEIENAILNLAINARDAMPKGGQLVIETANVVAGDSEIGSIDKLGAGEYVRLSVTDTGCGMPPEVLQRAFEPFFTTKAPGKGTGLGLSTLYGLARELGGTATISSEAGRGTAVALYLPKSEFGAAPVPAEPPSETVPRAAGEIVLLVEDNADVREVTRSHLTGLGYRALEAENGAAALDILRSGAAIDLVLSDVVMAGGLSGFDVARWVRANAPSVKILLTSGYAGEALRGEAALVPEPALLRKPYSRSELARALRQALAA
jgi:PAS domain S-box-containing protein